MTIKMQPRSVLWALGLFLFGCPSGGIRAGEDIVVGMSAAFTGPSQGLGFELYRGAMAYIENVNRSGGVHGRRIVLRAYDDGYDPLPAIANTVRLIEKDDALLLFGYVGTPTVTRVLPLLKRYSDRPVYLFFPFTGAQPHRQPPYAEYVFNLRASYQEETKGLVDHFVAIGRRRIAVFYQIDAYGRSGWDGVRRALAAHGLSLVAEATYRRGTPFSQSLSQQVEIFRQAKPDAIISVGSYAACAAFIRDTRDAGWDVPIANVSFVGSENLLKLLLESGTADPSHYTKNLINSQVVPSYHDADLPAVAEYRELIERYHAELPNPGYRPLEHSFVSFEGFLDAKLLVEIVKRMGPTLDKRYIRPAVESIHDLDLGIGIPVSFGSGKHQGLSQVYYTVVDNDRFVSLTDWNRWRQ